MPDMFDYLQWRGDILFSQVPLNHVDSLIFSALAYISFRGIVPEEPGRWMTLESAAAQLLTREDAMTRCRVPADISLLQAAAATQRFGRVGISYYQDIFVPEEDTQFAAISFYLEDGRVFLAFRGTDNSLVGWKEDFNMTFQESVPAQRLAKDYTEEFASVSTAQLYLGGHSKGGNLAVFAAARSSPMIQQRMLEVYNNDGPGFTAYLMGDPGYLAMVPRIKTYIPQSSVIGMLLEHEEPYTVIRSKSIGLLQHDPYTWDVLGKSFLTVEEITEGSQFVDATIKTWFSEMTSQERGQLVDVMYALLGSGGAENVSDLLHPRNIRTYIKTLTNDEHLRRVLSTEFSGLIEAARKTKAKFDEKRESQLLLEEPEV